MSALYKQKQTFTTNLLGVNVSAIDYITALNLINQWIEKSLKIYICVAAVHLVMECHKDNQLRKGVNKAALVTPDGMPLVWLLKLYGHKQASRVYGPTLMFKLCKLAQQKNYSILLLGGHKGQCNLLKKKLKNKFPKLTIMAAIDTPIRPLSEKLNSSIIKQINSFNPHIVFIGMGCPHQEKWMIENRKNVNANVLIGVGAAFDFLSGRVKQAPHWIQNIGLEWLYRFVKEPKRLWYRYTVMNIKFLHLITKQLVHDFLLK